MTKPLKIRGVTYPSQYAAAKALGVNPSTIRAAVVRGTLATVGMGKAGMTARAMPIRIRGKVYKNAATAALAFGVTRACVYRHLAAGTEDRIGVGSGSHSHSRWKAKPITVAGVTYPSRSALSRALGMSHGYVANALNAGRYQDVVNKIIEVFGQASPQPASSAPIRSAPVSTDRSPPSNANAAA